MNNLQDIIHSQRDGLFPQHTHIVRDELKRFNNDYTLYSYQIDALENVLKLLAYYYNDYAPGQVENHETHQNRKERLFKVYQDHMPEKSGDKKPIITEDMVNMACFWMATGSGKTLVLVKLIEMLCRWMDAGLIPHREILFSSAKPELVGQIKEHFGYLQQATDYRFELVSLKEYRNKRSEGIHLGDIGRKITVYYYRSDLIDDIKLDKENKLGYENYLNGGKWYMFLDEAHKGSGDDSKRHNIYKEMTQHGFLFNFSATFTSDLHRVTTVFNYNLAKFIENGHGKKIKVLSTDMTSLKISGGKYTSEEEAQSVAILKSFILLTYIKQSRKNLEDPYHEPMMMILVNSINKEIQDNKDGDIVKEPDMLRVFTRIVDIAKSSNIENYFTQAKDELRNELSGKYTLGDGEIKLDESIFGGITLNNVRELIFHSKETSNIEIAEPKGNNKELLFKLQNTDKPFALMKVGDAPKLKNGIINHKDFSNKYIPSQKSYNEKSFFDNLNNDGNTVNILMGSRAFYEGWDSNRPNVIMFINIGSNDSKKYVPQAIGRGVRIQPTKDSRLRKGNSPIEDLYIVATANKSVENLLQDMDLTEKERDGMETIQLEKNSEGIEKNAPLLIPKYSKEEKELYKTNEKPTASFELSQHNFDLLKTWFKEENIPVLLLRYPQFNLTFIHWAIGVLKQDTNEIFKINKEKNYKSDITLMNSLYQYASQKQERLDSVEELGEDTIKHYKEIKVSIKKKIELEEKIDKVLNHKKIDIQKLKEAGLTEKQIDTLNQPSEKLDNLYIEKIMKHYYIPTLKARTKLDWISNIIKEQSEYDFINELVKHIPKIDNSIKWFFSRIEEREDNIYVPYLENNDLRKFFPDFIFWIHREDTHEIVFVDPKGLAHTNWQKKVDGFNELFNKDKKLTYNNKNVKVKLFIYNTTVKPSKQYESYVIDDVLKIFNK